MLGIRKTMKSLVKSVLGIQDNPVQVTEWERPNFQSEPEPSEKTVSSGTSKAEDSMTFIEELDAPEVSEEESAAEGMELTIENLEQVIDEYIRPGVAADGGDIQLVKLEGRNVYVRLTGACQSCSSAIMTMKMGVEALLREEFPSMEKLIDETDYAV